MKTYTLSEAQKRIWYTQIIHNNSPLFNIGGTVKIYGEENIQVLKQAFIDVLNQNPVLRLEFIEVERNVRQYINDAVHAPDYIDFCATTDPTGAFLKWCAKQARTPFAMCENALYYFAVFRLPDCIGYFIKLHHILLDGWSIQIFTNQIAAAYESNINGNKAVFTEQLSYFDFITEEAKKEIPARTEEAISRWIDMFSPLPELQTEGFTDIKGERLSFIIENDVTDKIQQFINHEQTSLNQLFICAYSLYEYKKNGRKDNIIGIPLLGRKRKEDRRILGTFTNTIPYRMKINTEITIKELLNQISSDTRTLLSLQMYPVNMLYEKLPGLKKGKLPYNACINCYNTKLPQTINGKPIVNEEFYNGEQEYNLQIIIRCWEESKIQIDFDYRTSVYTSEQIKEMKTHIMEIVEQCIKNTSNRIKYISLLTENEKNRVLYALNDTTQPIPKTNIIEQFSFHVKTNPNKIAVSHGFDFITYEQLNDRINRVAHNLQLSGVAKNDIVAIIPEYKITSIVAILAIMKCGGIYLPLDKEYPGKRILEILERSSTQFLISSEKIDGFNGIEISFVQLLSTENCNKDTNDKCISESAYIIYTSGTTGKPKGITISHSNLMNYLYWARNTYCKNTNEVFALYSPFAFDFSITTLFLPLLIGGEIRIYDNSKYENVFNKILKDKKISILKVMPSHIPLLLMNKENDCDIHCIIIGGENLKEKDCRSLYEHFTGKARIYNEYGPTEATVGCIVHQYDYNNDREKTYIPIGKPIANTKIYLLDNDGQPVSSNIHGEIYIGGKSVSKTLEMCNEGVVGKLLQDPFSEDSVIYRTGDIAYRDNKDNLIYIGRKDNEIKLRGYRINLNEIERKIIESGMVKDAIVKEIKKKDGVGQLAAFIIADSWGQNEKRFRNYLRDHLPSYMIPDNFVCLEQFPISISGKIDKNALIIPNNSENNAIKTNNPLLEQLLEVICDLLNEQIVSAEDNFYAIGGDSIKAIQLSSKLKDLGYVLDVKNILAYPRVIDMVEFMHQYQYQLKQISQDICEGPIDITPIFCWFINQNFKQPGHYNQSILLKLNGHYTEYKLNKAFLRLICHHDALRLNWDKENSHLFYNSLHSNHSNVLRVIQIDHKINESVETAIKKEINHQYDISADLLFRPYLIILGNNSYLYISAHHLVIDAVSWQIILDDLTKLLLSDNDEYIALPEKTASFSYYANKYTNWVKSIPINHSFWKEQFDAAKQFNIEFYKNGCTEAITNCFELNEKTTLELMEKANFPYSTYTEELLLLAVYRTLKELQIKDEIIFEMEHHGRNQIEEVDTSRTVGWFTQIYPLKLNIGVDSLSQQILETKEKMREAKKIAHEYGKYLLDGKYMPIQARFNYLGEPTGVKNNCFTLEKILFYWDISTQNKSTVLFDIVAIVINKKMNFYVTYKNYPDINEKTKEINELMKHHIRIIIDHCIEKKERVYTPKDFDLADLSQKELDKIIGRMTK
jgi:amino acid adenylation domain-containing protein/non-ribosomal peptide synthase protein (TIGR01720 family)